MKSRVVGRGARGSGFEISDCLGCLNWEEGGSELIAHMRDIQESAGNRQLDGWRWVSMGVLVSATCMFLTLES